MADKLVPEQQIKSNWGRILDPSVAAASAITASHPLPGEEVIILDNIFSPVEISLLLQSAEKEGFGYTSYPKDYRGNLRLMTADPSLAAALWTRLKSFVPKHVDFEGQRWVAFGLNGLCTALVVVNRSSSAHRIGRSMFPWSFHSWCSFRMLEAGQVLPRRPIRGACRCQLLPQLQRAVFVHSQYLHERGL